MFLRRFAVIVPRSTRFFSSKDSLDVASTIAELNKAPFINRVKGVVQGTAILDVILHSMGSISGTNGGSIGWELAVMVPYGWEVEVTGKSGDKVWSNCGGRGGLQGTAFPDLRDVPEILATWGEHYTEWPMGLGSEDLHKLFVFALSLKLGSVGLKALCEGYNGVLLRSIFWMGVGFLSLFTFAGGSRDGTGIGFKDREVSIDRRWFTAFCRARHCVISAYAGLSWAGKVFLGRRLDQRVRMSVDQIV
ncbi:hypothetical protein GOBAR_DD23029 [Gossypium barbadense]|nr:hypothetical protein GOBAR_DD23029 [Gossypium barbadense]